MNISKKEVLKIAMGLVKHKINRERDGLELRILGCEYLKLRTKCETLGSEDDDLIRLEMLRDNYAKKWRDLEDYKVFISVKFCDVKLSIQKSIPGYFSLGLIDEIEFDFESSSVLNQAVEIVKDALERIEITQNKSRQKRLESMRAYRRRKKLAATAA